MIEQECVETVEMTIAALEAVEERIADRLKLGRHVNVRAELCRRAREGVLQEDELVSEWHALYSSYVDWQRGQHED